MPAAGSQAATAIRRKSSTGPVSSRRFFAAASLMSEPIPQILEPADLDALREADQNVTIVQVVDPASFATAHIPGAQLVAPGELVGGEPPATGRLPPVPRLRALFGRLGHRAETTYVVADDEGGGWAGRFAWTLDVIGHSRWNYLNGGIHAWVASGREVAAGAPHPVPGTSVEITVDTGPIAEADELMARLGDPDLVIWDVRSAEEFRGERVSAQRAGHIPGAVNMDWMRLKDPARAQRLPEDLAQMLESSGINENKEVITHCQTHHRSGLSYMIGRLLGFPRIRAYHGSWSEWGNRPDTPIDTGP